MSSIRIGSMRTSKERTAAKEFVADFVEQVQRARPICEFSASPSGPTGLLAAHA
jgi:hypothetical protein